MHFIAESFYQFGYYTQKKLHTQEVALPFQSTEQSLP